LTQIKIIVGLIGQNYGTIGSAQTGKGERTMPDRENVMGWLEGLAEPDWRECYSDSEVQETARQALDLIDELLKEQEETELCDRCGRRRLKSNRVKGR
jgi:hypothetical protein